MNIHMTAFFTGDWWLNEVNQARFVWSYYIIYMCLRSVCFVIYGASVFEISLFRKVITYMCLRSVCYVIHGVSMFKISLFRKVITCMCLRSVSFVIHGVSMFVRS